MTRPLTQTYNCATRQNVTREMNDAEFAEWQSQSAQVATEPAPTKEQLLAQLNAIAAQIQALS